MLQTVDGHDVFVVDFDTMPELPITWTTDEEKPFAQALQVAILDGVITEPGKYGIQVEHVNQTTSYTIHTIKE